MTDQYRALPGDNPGDLYRQFKLIGTHPVSGEAVYAPVIALESGSIGSGGGGGTSSVVNIADPTTATQKLAIDASGRITIPLGAATSAKQDSQITLLGGGLPSVLATDRLKVDVTGQTIATTLAALTDGTARIGGTVAVTQSGTWTVQPGNTANTTAWKVDGSAVAQPVTDNSGSLTVDAPVGTPVFVRLSDGSAAITTLAVSLASVPSHAVTNTGTFAVQATEADGANTTLGALADAAVGDASGTVNAHIRQVAKLLAAALTVNQGGSPWGVSLAAETTKVIGVTRSADGSGNLLTSTTNALDVNLKTSSLTNQSVNQAQVAGTATSVSNGTVDNGTQRVTIASNSTGQVALAAGAALIGQVAASAETNTIYQGTTALTPKFATIVASSSGATQVVALVSNKKIRVLGYVLVANAAVNVKFQSHVTPTDKTGLLYLAANTGVSAGFSPVGLFETIAGEALDINLSGAVAVGGHLVYVEA